MKAPGFGLLLLQTLLVAAGMLLADAPVPWLVAFTVIFAGVSAWRVRALLGDAEEDRDVELTRMQGDLRESTEALERERAELSVLMSSISEAILAVDESGKILFFNDRFRAFFGAVGLTERRTTLREVFRASEVADVFQQAQRELAQRHSEVDLSVAGESQPRTFDLAVTPLRSLQGAVYGCVGVFHDVTELKRAERMRIDFVANVSHELRSPLTAIKGYSDTLRSDFESGRMEDIPGFVDVISRNADRLMALIGDLLDLSSIESGGEINRQWVMSGDLSQRVLRQLEPRRAQRDMQARVEVEPGAERIYADPGRLEQVLVNLVDNAFKYTQEGGQVRVAWEKGPGGGVRLRVADNGPGIPEESRARIFERFYRVDKARSREVGGTGLGLSIVKHIVQRHGGSVELRSAPGQGTEFLCDFPGPEGT